MEFFTVQQIAEKRGVSARAIYKQIKTHRRELEGHSTKREGKIWYDAEAVRILEAAAVNSAPVVVETRQRQEVEELKAEIVRLKAQHDEDHQKLAEAMAAMTELVKQSSENARLAAESRLLIEQKTQAEERTKELEAELDRIKARGLWDRILNK